MKLKTKTLNYIVYLLVIVAFILVLYYTLLISSNNNNQIDNFVNDNATDFKDNNLNPCIGSYHYPNLNKCPPERKYLYAHPNNGASGVCCHSKPHAGFNHDLYNCVEGLYREKGCLENEVERTPPNNKSGYCCVPKDNFKGKGKGKGMGTGKGKGKDKGTGAAPKQNKK